MPSDYRQLFSTYVKGLKVGANGEASGHCPFHEDMVRSFNVNLNSGLWICHAGCGSGNAKQFCDKLGIDSKQFNPDEHVKIRKYPKRETKIEISQKDREKVFGFHKYLMNNFNNHCSNLPWSLDVIKRTYTGFDPNTKRFTFVNCDQEGKVISVKIHKSVKGERPYQIGNGTCKFYPLQLLKGYSKSEPLIICEGEKDSITLLSQGFNSLTSTTGAFSCPTDLIPLADFNKIYIVYDNDKSGIEGSQRIASAIKKKYPAHTIKIWNWIDKPEKYDITDFFRNGGSVEKFKTELALAVPFELKNDDKSQQFNLSDSGNAELLGHLFANKIRYEHIIGRWLIWNGQYFRPDDKNEILNLAKRTARRWKKMAIDLQDPKKATEYFKFGLKSENKIKMQCSIDIAKSLPKIATLPENWNVDPYLLQFLNGTLNLKTMNFSAGKPTDLISQCVGYEYDKKATCPTFRRAISEIFNKDTALVKFFQRALGYSLTGDILEHCFFMLQGSGANGKTVVLEIMKLLLGDYSVNSPFSAFEHKYGNYQTNDLARLNFARLVTTSESGSTKRLDEERLKATTGGDSITARFLHKEYFTFNPRFKLWMAVNSLPDISDFSYGFWRRVRLIPFEVRFLGNRADPHLLEKLKPELPGIMNWAIEGLIKWKQIGLNPPSKVINATLNYQIESDVVAEFISEFTLKNPKAKIKARELYKNYCMWHNLEYSEKPLTQTSFGRRVTLLTGLKSKPQGKNRRKTYIGLDMKNDFRTILKK
ncbi:MAG: phage/plasmid primase, P4 family [Promethearchaeota archaeon]